jgi:hypothetical protein
VADDPDIGDDEILLRHIPPGTFYLTPVGRITSGNFALRPGEEGTSVTIERVTDALTLLTLVQSKPDSRVARARVGDIRKLGFKVVRKPVPQDPEGHCEIQSDRLGLDEHLHRKKLANLFTLLTPES